MDYLDWNDAIAATFFRPEAAGSRVYLYVTDATIDEIGRSCGANFSDFMEAVKQGPPGASGRLECDKAIKLFENWRDANRPYPPYIGYLALFVLAAWHVGDFSPRAYHPKLRQLLDPSDTSKSEYPSFRKTYQLWSDLEVWANKDKQGELGLFHADIVGIDFHVGIPKAQTILSEKERIELPNIFAKANLDRGMALSDDELAAVVTEFGAGILKSTTLKFLKGSEEARAILLRTICEQYAAWDGDSSESGTRRNCAGSLILSLVYHPGPERASMRLHARNRQGLPEDPVLLRDQTGRQLVCDAGGCEVSMPLFDATTDSEIDASEIDWTEQYMIEDVDSLSYFRMRGAPVRLFVHGGLQGINGMIETNQLLRRKPFFILAHELCHSIIDAWGRSSCRGFEEITVLSGLPRSWRLYSADEAINDNEVRRYFPVLSFSKEPRLQIDGIRVGKGNSFFDFAPPRITVSGVDSGVEITCDGATLAPICTDDGLVFNLPESVAKDKFVPIELFYNGDRLQRRFVYLASSFDVPDTPDYPKFNRNWVSTNDSLAPSFVNNRLVNLKIPKCPYYLFQMPQQPGARFFLVGTEPGQIVKFPKDPLPTDWSPAWIVALKRKGFAVYCEQLRGSEDPGLTETGDRKKQKLWKSLVWHRRRKIVWHTNSASAEIRKSMKEMARHVGR